MGLCSPGTWITQEGCSWLLHECKHSGHVRLKFDQTKKKPQLIFLMSYIWKRKHWIKKFIYVDFRHLSFFIFEGKKHFTGNDLLTAVLALRRLYNSRLMPRRSNHSTTYWPVDAGLNLFNQLLILEYQHFINYRPFVTREPCENKDTVLTWQPSFFLCVFLFVRVQNIFFAVTHCVPASTIRAHITAHL